LFKKFFKTEKPDYNQIMTELISSFSLVVDSQKILDTIKGRFLDFFPVEKVYFLIRNEDENFYLIDNSADIEFENDSNFAKWFFTNATFLTIDDDDSLYEYLGLSVFRDMNIRYIFPLETHNNVLGFGLLECDPIDDGNLEFFQILFRLTALAYENSVRLKREMEQLETSYQQEKMATIGQMASALAHEIKNPLTSIRSTIQFIKQAVEPDEMKEIVEEVIEEVDRVNDITNSLLDYARPRNLQIGEIFLHQLLNSIKMLYESQLNEKNIEFVSVIPQSVVINGDEDAFRQILQNFMLNSIDAVEDAEEKRIKVRLAPVETQQGKYLFEWLDTGKGIPEDKIDMIFEPFYTTKKLGSGLGLAVTKQLLDQHGYGISVQSKVGKGTKFSFLVDGKFEEEI
jgi:signal transduction histidine kinase